jgi:hypothetical protein
LSKANRRLSTPSGTTSPINRRSVITGIITAAAASTTAMATPMSADTDLLAMVNRHDGLWAEWDRLAKVDEDDPRIPALSDETSELAKRIVVTPAHTVEGLNGKVRVVALEELESWDDIGLIEIILQLDAERVAAAR